MDKQEAEDFRKMWKKTPRSLKSSTLPKNHRKNSINFDLLAALRYKDVEKGLELMGKGLAEMYKVEWKEYWPFLDSFVDVASQDGLELLEKFLAFRMNSESSPVRVPCKNISPADVSGKSVCSFVRGESHTLSDLCKAFETWNLSDHSPKEINIRVKSHGDEKHLDLLTNNDKSRQTLSPFLYLEKSCQVFGHRISQPVLNMLNNEYNSTVQTLESEIKHLEQLMTSYMEDSRFLTVDFSVVHSRLGLLISNRLKEVLKREDDFDFVHKKLESLLERCNKHLDYFSSDDESINHRQTRQVKKKSTSTNKQLMCLLEFVLNSLSNSDVVVTEVNTEAECVAVWNGAKCCSCVWQAKGTKKLSSLSRSNSLKLASRNLYTVAKNNEDNNISRRLSFDDEDSGGKWYKYV